MNQCFVRFPTAERELCICLHFSYFSGEWMDSTGCCITQPYSFFKQIPSFIDNVISARKPFYSDPSMVFMKIQSSGSEGSSSIPLFGLLGYVWEQVGQQIGFGYNVIIIDLPVVKEADRQASKINQCIHRAGILVQEAMLPDLKTSHVQN